MEKYPNNTIFCILRKHLIQLNFLFEIMRILQLHCDSIEYTPTKKRDQKCGGY